jgi:hypothetical protein
MVTSRSSAVPTLRAVTEAPHPATVVSLPRLPGHATTADPVDRATQRLRRLRFTAARAGARLRSSLLAKGSARRRQAWQVCSAARLLTALGVRVDVVQPETPWPRDRAQQLRVTNEAGLFGDLALLTAVPRTTPGWAAVADRVLPTGNTRPTAEQDPGDAVVCRVTIGYRTAAGPLTGSPRTPAQVAAARGLVIEVRLLPAVGVIHSAA